MLGHLAGNAWSGSVVLAVYIATLKELPCKCFHKCFHGDDAGDVVPDSDSDMKSDDIDTVVRLALSQSAPAGSSGSMSTEAAAP